MNSMLNNYVNGNLWDARKQASRFSHAAIRNALRALFGYSIRKAALVADYLKTGEDFQAACDAE